MVLPQINPLGSFLPLLRAFQWGTFARMLCNWNGVFASFANGSCRKGICWILSLCHAEFIKIHFLPHLESFMWERIFEKNFFLKKVIYKSLMGCFLFSNSNLQLGVTVMGYAEHFGLKVVCHSKNMICILIRKCKH